MRITEGCVGIMLSGITDRIGRRKSAQIFLLVNLLAQAVIIFVPTYYGKLLGYIIYACGNTKNSIAFVWMFELVETKYKSACCSAINVVDTLTMVVVGFYILFVSRNWFPIEFAIFVVSLINYACMCFLMPESPKWLLITGRVDKAITEFNYIAKVNGSL